MGDNHKPLLSLDISDCRNGLGSETVKTGYRLNNWNPPSLHTPCWDVIVTTMQWEKGQLKNKSSKLNRLSITLDADNPISRNVQAPYGWFAVTYSSKTSLLFGVFCASKHCSQKDSHRDMLFSCLSQNEAIQNQSNATLLKAQLSTDLS